MHDKHPLLTTLLLLLPLAALAAWAWWRYGDMITNALFAALKLVVTR